MAKWRANNHDLANKRAREYYHEHREQELERGKKYRENHHEQVLESVTKWRESHREEGREATKKWRENNRDHYESIGRKSAVMWRKNHPEKVNEQSRNKRAQKAGALGFNTQSDIVAIYEAQDGRCYYCDEVLDQTYHVDHKQPTSRGGSNWPENLCVTCPTCNMRKNAQTEAEFVLRQFAGSPCST